MVILRTPMKHCSGCDTTKPESSFYWNKYRDRPWTRRARCIECHLIAQNRHDQRRPNRRVYDAQRWPKRKRKEKRNDPLTETPPNAR